MKNFQAGLRKQVVAGWLLPTDHNTTWIETVITGGGGGADGVGLQERIDLTAQCNGVTTSFSLGVVPPVDRELVVIRNGLVVRTGYNFVGSTLNTTGFTPQTGDTLEVIW